jgi:hypothetical protein
MLLLLAATPCVAKCHKDYFKFIHGSETSTTMHVSSGASCAIKFTITGSRPSTLSRSPNRQSTVRRLGTASVAILRSRTDHRQDTEARTSFYLASRARAPEATAQPTCASPWWWSRSLQRGAGAALRIAKATHGLALEAAEARQNPASTTLPMARPDLRNAIARIRLVASMRP